MYNTIRVSCFLFSLLVVQCAFADQVWLKNGDVISGTLQGMHDAEIRVQSSMLGLVSIEAKHVEAISTDAPKVVTFSNQDRVTGQFVKTGNQFSLRTERFGDLGAISLAQIQSIQSSGHGDISTGEFADTTQVMQNVSVIADRKAVPGELKDADVVVLHSGDRLVGNITEINEESLKIDTKFASSITILRDKISSVHTHEPMTLVFEDDAYATGTITSDGDGNLLLDSDLSNQSKPFQLSNVRMAVKGDPQQIIQEREKVKLTGRLNVGLSRSSGNSKNENYAGQGELRARTQTNRITLRGERIFERSDGDKTEDQTFGSIKYDQFFGEKWFMFVSTSFEEDEIELLNLRTALSSGVGYQFYERDDLFLSAETGLAYVNEDFDEDEDNDTISLRWGVDYEQDVFSWLSLFHYQDGLFGIEDTDDIVIRTRNGLRFPLGNGFNATAQANFDWDKSPAEGVSSTDKEYLFTLGYEFKR